MLFKTNKATIATSSTVATDSNLSKVDMDDKVHRVKGHPLICI
jgi:hypothetical protein